MPERRGCPLAPVFAVLGLFWAIALFAVLTWWIGLTGWVVLLSRWL